MNKKEKSAARKRTFRSEQTDEAKADASAQFQARMTHRNQQSEEEQEQRSEQAQARMTPLRGNQTPAEQKQATSLNSKARNSKHWCISICEVNCARQLSSLHQVAEIHTLKNTTRIPIGLIH